MPFVIFQPDRYLLKQAIIKFGTAITGSMLDVGAGEVDRYAKFFRYEKRTTTDVNKSANVDVIASADNLPFENERFDSVVSTQVLEHVHEPAKVISEIARVLKKGGTALISAPQTAERHEEPYDFFRYTSYGLQYLCEKAGLDVIEIVQLGGFRTLITQQRIRHLINTFDLYNRPFFGKIAGKFFSVYGRWMIRRDEKDTNEMNKKFTLGYVVLAKKHT